MLPSEIRLVNQNPERGPGHSHEAELGQRNKAPDFESKVILVHRDCLITIL